MDFEYNNEQAKKKNRKINRFIFFTKLDKLTVYICEKERFAKINTFTHLVINLAIKRHR